jgi:hypothetical protein
LLSKLLLVKLAFAVAVADGNVERVDSDYLMSRCYLKYDRKYSAPLLFLVLSPVDPD